MKKIKKGEHVRAVGFWNEVEFDGVCTGWDNILNCYWVKLNGISVRAKNIVGVFDEKLKLIPTKLKDK